MLNFPEVDHAAVIECYLSPPTSDIEQCTFPSEKLTAFHLSDSRWFVLLVHYVAVTSEFLKQMNAVRLEITETAKSNNIELKPKFRAVGFTQHANEPLKGLIEIVPYQ